MKKKFNKSNKNDLLKTIGIVSMLVDHVGLILFPQVQIFRAIGRLAFPVFAFAISDGYRYTSNLKKYFFRLLIFAVVSQIPFMLAINPWKLNVIFTLVLSLAVLHFFSKKNYIVVIILVTVSVIIPMDFGIYGALAASIFYFFKNKNHQIGAFVLLTIVHVTILGWALQLLSIFGVLIILFFPDRMPKVQLPRYFFYWFYPVHLLLLFVIKQYLMTN
ncbi:MAG: TraX family protein [Patescibacteria group bacterium]|nr:TraX family protein [Patescibacteria group bacterium]